MSPSRRSLEELLRSPFYKMSGSGNDFVFVDALASGSPDDYPAGVIAAVCARGPGVGADGLVVMDQPGPGRVRIAYFNSDGSRASLCGNATLCSARLAVHLGAVPAGVPFQIDTDAGALRAFAAEHGDPYFELAPVVSVRTSEAGPLVGQGPAAEVDVGYAVAGVPHVVVRVADVAAVKLETQGPEYRRPTEARPDGANVNFVSPDTNGRWRMRTYERGVEGETLACGTGAVACATLLQSWNVAARRVELVTQSGRVLTVTLPDAEDAAGTGPRLQGEGRVVFTGTLGPGALA